VPGEIQDKLSDHRRKEQKKETKIVEMRFLEERDLEFRVSLFNDESILPKMGFRQPIQLEKTKEWYKRIQQKSDRADFVFFQGEKVLGMGGLVNINEIDENAELYIAMFPSYQGQGFGTICLLKICSYGFDMLNLHRIYLYMFFDNLQALKFYEKVGFQKEGILREHCFKDGEFKDRYVLGILKKEWESLKNGREKEAFIR